ncbi:folate-binding protein [Alcanivorax sp. S6407]|uniref:CAF17-like 4Fe-4S cluster assembly/insertion protein YgfZ n=1 Tax=Alcanivorax sp. S6407 TaxID=2926424 RepID=UPI001FF3F678|nr:folate-binding protein [Alcanivorax sp. S6407]MCK0152776.1 folate-binding protein [Alcanivorax sp. S6407]
MSWSDFLAKQSLPPVADAPYLAPALHMTIVRAHGDEAGHYLQGQLSCDLREVDQGAHLTGMHLSLKGRGLVSVRVLRDGNDYLLLTPAGQGEALIKALLKYRLRAKVEFQQADDQALLLLAGNLPEHLPAPGQTLRTEQGLWLRYPNTQHALLIIDANQVESTWAALAADRQPVAANGAVLADIDAGEGMVYPGAEDLFLPQVLNYDVTAGVNFKKGCYTGQEVVARMHFKGKLKQRMQRINFTADIALQPGEVLRDADGKAAGEVVISTNTANGGAALVVLRRDSDGVLYKDDTPLDSKLGELPYTLPWKD